MTWPGQKGARSARGTMLHSTMSEIPQHCRINKRPGQSERHSSVRGVKPAKTTLHWQEGLVVTSFAIFFWFVRLPSSVIKTDFLCRRCENWRERTERLQEVCDVRVKATFQGTGADIHLLMFTSHPTSARLRQRACCSRRK